jgi:hypothetical protein
MEFRYMSVLVEAVPVVGEAVGLGQPVRKLVESMTGRIIAYVGMVGGEHQVYFPRPVALNDMQLVTNHLKKENGHAPQRSV